MLRWGKKLNAGSLRARKCLRTVVVALGQPILISAGIVLKPDVSFFNLFTKWPNLHCIAET